MSRSNGRPELEVIANVRAALLLQGFIISIHVHQFIDGLSYSKGKLEEAFRPGGFLEKPPPKPQKDVLPSFVKKEDVEIIVRPLVSSLLSLGVAYVGLRDADT
jgi:hypothetical protein